MGALVVGERIPMWATFKLGMQEARRWCVHRLMGFPKSQCFIHHVSGDGEYAYVAKVTKFHLRSNELIYIVNKKMEGA
jgi:hypothetical protein